MNDYTYLLIFVELENEDAYKSGDKCLKVIVFCPKDKIFPAFQQGDGTTLFYAKKGDSVRFIHLILFIIYASYQIHNSHIHNFLER